MDVSCALDYLHNRSQKTIIHGDLKPSNILLDDEMVAHVRDFGLAQFLGIDANQNSSTGIKGTIEYGLGNEMTSSEDVQLWNIIIRDHVVDVIDGDAIILLTVEANAHKLEECLTSVVKIEVSCSEQYEEQKENEGFDGDLNGEQFPPIKEKAQNMNEKLNSPCLDKNTSSAGIDDCVDTGDEDDSVVKVAKSVENKEGCSSNSGCGKENPWNLYT
ncbi:kinase-like domain-containing protein [Tanacetum coccineum]